MIYISIRQEFGMFQNLLYEFFMSKIRQYLFMRNFLYITMEVLKFIACIWEKKDTFITMLCFSKKVTRYFHKFKH